MNGQKPVFKLAEMLKDAPDEVFIQPHNVPDPDAIASSFALQRLLEKLNVPSVIVFDREIEKSNSVRMLEIFGIEMKNAFSVDTMGEEDWTVLVDVQKENANLTDLVTEEVACIDHHDDNGFSDYKFKDVRPEYGACSTIIASYWNDAGLIPEREVATALLYGIRSDTSGLSRGVSIHDIEAYYNLYPLADMSKITELDNNSIDISVLTNFARAFETVEVYGKIGFLSLESEDDSLLGAAGDILLSVENVDIVVAYAVRKTGLKYSVRSIDKKVAASDLIKHIVGSYGVGGGHKTMAGGFIPKEKFPSDRSYATYTRVAAVNYVEQQAGSE